MKQLKCGHSVSNNFDHEKIDYSGKVTDLHKINKESRKAEITEIIDGTTFYYYYEEETLKYIEHGENPSSGIRDMCENCLRDTLQTNEPHYGDGVYFTQNPALRDPITHQEVIDSHGIGIRKYRALYMCSNSSHFRKIRKTGGVVRSTKHREHNNRLSLLDGIVIQMSL